MVIKKTNVLLLVTFILLISAPLIDMKWKIDPFPYLDENRKLAEFPDMKPDFEELPTFVEKFESYYNDHFGFRNSLIRLNFFVKYKLLGISPSDKVIVGKNGWLFNASDGEMYDYRGMPEFDETMLQKSVAFIERKRQFLEQRGIKYIFVIAPNKSTVYRELMPDSINRLRTGTVTDDLVSCLRKHSNVTVIDLRQALLTCKNMRQVYYKTDSHWNAYGAFAAYQEIVKPLVKWFPNIKSLELSDFTTVDKINYRGDLARLIGGTGFIKDEFVGIKPSKPFKAKRVEVPNGPLVMTQNGQQLPRAVIFRDSFFDELAPFISENMDYSVYYPHQWDYQTPIFNILETQHPDVVIEEVVERNIKFIQG